MHFTHRRFLSKTHTNLPVTLGVVELLTMLVVCFLGVDSENVYKLISKAKIYIMKNSTIINNQHYFLNIMVKLQLPSLLFVRDSNYNTFRENKFHFACLT